mgnify:CR=1 FL=1
MNDPGAMLGIVAVGLWILLYLFGGGDDNDPNNSNNRCYTYQT